MTLFASESGPKKFSCIFMRSSASFTVIFASSRGGRLKFHHSLTGITWIPQNSYERMPGHNAQKSARIGNSNSNNNGACMTSLSHSETTYKSEAYTEQLPFLSPPNISLMGTYFVQGIYFDCEVPSYIDERTSERLLLGYRRKHPSRSRKSFNPMNNGSSLRKPYTKRFAKSHPRATLLIPTPSNTRIYKYSRQRRTFQV